MPKQLSITVLLGTALLAAALGFLAFLASAPTGPNWIGEITFSDDGTIIAANCGNEGVWVWHMRAAKPMRKRLSLPNAQYSGDFGTIQFEDSAVLVFYGRNILDGRGRPPEIVFWDMREDRRMRSVRLPYSPRFHCIAPATRVVVISPNTPDIKLGAEWKIIDLNSGRETGMIPIGEGRGEGFASEITISRNGKRLVAAVYAARWGSEVWDLGTGKRIFQSDTHSIESISDDGRVVALRSAYTFNVQFWRLDEPRLLWTFDGPFGSISFIGDGHTFVSAGSNLEVWDLDKKKPVGQLAQRPEVEPICLRISPNGSRIGASTGEKVIVWNLADYSRILELR